MADKLKEFFDESVVKSIARDVRVAHPSFKERAFVSACLDGLQALELTARAGHIATALAQHLPPDFEAAADVLRRSLGPESTNGESVGLSPFRYLPHTIFVARHGLAHFETSMALQYELTKRFTAEFSIRPFLIHHPDATYERLLSWARDPNVHVRRLVSEGTRPRLPWAPRLPAFQKDPAPVLRLLELLKDDPERYVQRSVANNLNDIAKDHPALAVEVCERWSVNASPSRTYIVKHALRSLIKQGHRGALGTIGFAAKPKAQVQRSKVEPKRVRLGEAIRFNFELISTSKGSQELLVDYAVHYVKSNGKVRDKVFKLQKITLSAQGRAELSAKVSFADLATRKHYPGRHLIEAIVNGVRFPIGHVDVLAKRP